MSNNIKENHIRHTQEALDDIFEGLKKQDIPTLSFALDQLIAFGLGFENYDKHEFECIYPSTHLVPDLPNLAYTEAWMSASLVQELLNHQYYDKNGDVWDDAVQKLIGQLLELLPSK